MVFSSLLFTFFFLPVVLVLHYFAKPAYRNYLLLAASLFFYAYGEPQFVLVMVAMILINYVLALLIDRYRENKPFTRGLLWLAVLSDIGLLFVYKYLGFTFATLNSLFHTTLSADIALPIGISFFTFQAMSYVIDVWRRTTQVQKNPFYVALYISFFPQLIAGPIVRYNTIAEQIRHRECTPGKFADGAKRFMLGFGKKVILANNLSVITSGVFAITNTAGHISQSMLWLGAVSYLLQLFYDFSGYSDMAIGLGKLFGFEFEENFRHPYASGSLSEFWRRWHISLGTWFRDYVYIPLGGSRVSAPRQIRNLFIVWALTGIWHGANWTYIVWGLWFFVLITVEKQFVRPWKRGRFFRCVVWRLVTLLCVMIGWVLFNSVNLGAALNYCCGLFGFYRELPSPGEASKALMPMVYYLREYGAYLLFALVLSTPLAQVAAKKADQNRTLMRLRLLAAPFVCGFVFLWSVSFLILGVHNPFIYFNF